MPTNASQNKSPLSTWALDREIVLSRVINAPRELISPPSLLGHSLPGSSQPQVRPCPLFRQKRK